MSYRSFTAGDIYTVVRGLLNDVDGDIYNDAALQPMLQVCIQEISENYELNGMAKTNNTSAIIEVDAGVERIGFTGDTSPPNLPDDLVEIEQLWYSPRDQNTWYAMSKRMFLPHYLNTTDINPLTIWAWYKERINLMVSNADNDIKIDYIQTLFPDIQNENTQLVLVNGRTVLEYRTAALAAEFVGENMTRADKLNLFAGPAMDRLLGIGTKATQVMPVRRRPFRAGFKSRRIVS